MAIIAKLLKAEPRDSGWKIEIEYTDGTEVSVITSRFFGKTVKDLKNFAIAQVNKKEDVKLTDFSQFVGEEIDVTPDPIVPPTPPTAEEIAKAAWFTDWAQFKEVQLLLNSVPGLATGPRVLFKDNLEASLEANWLDSYLGDL